MRTVTDAARIYLPSTHAGQAVLWLGSCVPFSLTQDELKQLSGCRIRGQAIAVGQPSTGEAIRWRFNGRPTALRGRHLLVAGAIIQAAGVPLDTVLQVADDLYGLRWSDFQRSSTWVVNVSLPDELRQAVHQRLISLRPETGSRWACTSGMNGLQFISQSSNWPDGPAEYLEALLQALALALTR